MPPAHGLDIRDCPPQAPIEDHFDRNLELEASLEAKGKGDIREMVRNIIPKGVNCVFARQPEALRLGHVVLCAALPTEALWQAHLQPRTSVISISRMAGDELSKYGIISAVEAGASGLQKNCRYR